MMMAMMKPMNNFDVGAQSDVKLHKNSKPMNHEKNLRPLVIFIILSLLFALLIALPAILENYGLIDVDIPLIPLLLVGSWTPNIAAFIVILYVLKRRGGVKKLFLRWTMWRESFWWYLVAVSPLVLCAIAVLLYRGLDAGATAGVEPPDIQYLLIFLVLALISGAMGEELGWRGFALPWLQTRFGALSASLVVGIVWGLWHLPLWFAGMGWETMSFGVFTWNCIAMSVILTWICNNTRGNMVLVTLFHMFYNFGFGLMNDVMNVPPEKGIIYLAGVLTVYVAVVLLIFGPGKLSGKDTVPVDQRLKSWVEV